MLDVFLIPQIWLRITSNYQILLSFSTVGFCYSRTVSNVSFCGKSTLGKGWLLTARPGGGVNRRLCNKFWYSSLTSSHSCKKYRYWAFYKTKTPSFFDDSQNLNHLKIELAAIVDCGEVFVKATYNLEGDGPLVLTCYETIQEVKSAIQVENIPKVRAIAKKNIIIRCSCKQQLTSSLKSSTCCF